MKVLLEVPGRLVEADDRTRTVATVLDDNPLAPEWDATAAIAGVTPDRPLIVWSGSCGAGPFDPHPHNWGATGAEALGRVCAAMAPGLGERRALVCFRPHARHVLSDAPSCRRFLHDHDHGNGPFGLALAPALLLEPSMLPAIEDHLTRIFETLARETRFLFLTDLVVVGEDCRAAPLGAGVMPRAHVLGLVAQYLAPDVPIVLMDEDLAAQRAWLRDD